MMGQCNDYGGCECELGVMLCSLWCELVGVAGALRAVFLLGVLYGTYRCQKDFFEKSDTF